MNSCKRLIFAKVFIQGYYPTLDFKGAFSSLRQFLAPESPLKKIMIYFFYLLLHRKISSRSQEI